MSLFWIKTENQWADLNTKNLPLSVFARHVNSIMGNEDFQDYFKKAVAKAACAKLYYDEEYDLHLFSESRAKFHQDAIVCAATASVLRPQASAARWFSLSDY
jgi:hypothetical protein